MVAFELCMKLRWLGFHTFIRHKRTMVKVHTHNFIGASQAVHIDCKQEWSQNRFLRDPVRPYILTRVTHYCLSVRWFTNSYSFSISYD